MPQFQKVFNLLQKLKLGNVKSFVYKYFMSIKHAVLLFLGLVVINFVIMTF